MGAPNEKSQAAQRSRVRLNDGLAAELAWIILQEPSRTPAK